MNVAGGEANARDSRRETERTSGEAPVPSSNDYIIEDAWSGAGSP